MRKSDLKVGMVVKTTRAKEMVSGASIAALRRLHSTQPVKLNTLFECVKTDAKNYYNNSCAVFRKLTSDGKEYADHKFYALGPLNNSLTYMKKADTAMIPERVQKAKFARNKIDSLAKQIEETTKELAKMNANKLELEKKAELLEKFASDEEELAYTLAQILRTGGDQEQILTILKNRAETSKL